MKIRNMTIHQTNMYCQKCFNNVIKALSKIEKLKQLQPGGFNYI